MKNNIVLLDIDDVVANLIERWLSAYNTLSGDNLTPDKILDWDISKFVKSDYKNVIYKFLDNQTIYDEVVPVEGALEGTKMLIAAGYRIVYVTSPVIKTAGVKFNWLVRNGFDIKQENYIEATDKSLIYGEYMIDDGIHNIATTIAPKALIYTRPWNVDYKTCYRVNNWEEILSWFLGGQAW